MYCFAYIYPKNRGGSKYLPETLAFLAAVEPYVTTQKPDAVDRLIRKCKQIGVWDKMYAFWIRYGDNANSQSFNLINPNTFKLIPSGVISRTNNVAESNGASGYENTQLTPSITLTIDDFYLSVTSLEDIAVSQCEIGARSSSNRFGIYALTGGTSFFIGSDGGLITYQFSPRTSIGRFVSKRKSITHWGLQNDTRILTTKLTASYNLPNIPMYLFGINNLGTASTLSSKKQTVAIVGKYISDWQDRELSNAINQYLLDVDQNTKVNVLESGTWDDTGCWTEDFKF